MRDEHTPKHFNTLRGFLNGKESDEEIRFAYSATLRIFGDGVPFEELSSTLGVEPTHTHHRGEKRTERHSGYRDDAWHYEPSLPESEPLDRHIEALWTVIQPHAAYIRSLKQKFKVDVFCGYRSNCDHAGFEVPHTALAMFAELEIPFGVSVIVV